MSDDSLLEIDASELEASVVRKSRNYWALAITVLALLFAAFQIYTAGAGPFLAFIQRSVHVCFALVLVTLVYRIKQQRIKPQHRLLYVWDLAVIAATVGITVYLIANVERLIFGIGYAHPSQADTVLGAMMLLILADACRKAVGWIFTACIAGLFAYALLGPFVPGVFRHAGFSLQFLTGTLFVNPLGMYGIVTGTSANIIAIYVIFGAVMLRTGAALGFLNLAIMAAGRLTGGAAQVAVVSSALLGMVNGSAVANVATVGAFTIPMMKKRGYPSAFAAGVESAASTGGQIMPPVMGAGAFIMAEILGIPYVQIAAMAAVPAILYFGAIMLIVYFEAKKRKLAKVPKEDIPAIRSYIRELVLLLVPVTVLVYLIIARFTPRMAAFWAIVLTVGLFLILSLPVFRRLSEGGVSPSLPASMNTAGMKLKDGLVEGASSAATLGVLCAGAQVMVGSLGLTGLGLKIAQYIQTIGGESRLPFLIAGMIMCLLMGMALPTVPSYLITAAMVVPVLQDLGLVPVATHLFIFYYACFSGLTPPVLGPVYAAAVYAGSNIWESAWEALKLASVGFIVPFVFVLNTEMLGLKGIVPALEALAFGMAGALVLASGIAGYWSRNLNLVQRLMLAAAGFALIVPETQARVGGAVVALIAIYGMRLWTGREKGGRNAEVPPIEVAES